MWGVPAGADIHICNRGVILPLILINNDITLSLNSCMSPTLVCLGIVQELSGGYDSSIFYLYVGNEPILYAFKNNIDYF
jgi:hypothetical protein